MLGSLDHVTRQLIVHTSPTKRSSDFIAHLEQWLPKYAPELNEIEPVWRDLKAHHLAHQTFTDVAALDQAIHDAVIDLNRERIPDPLAMPRISA
jgi:transposase